MLLQNKQTREKKNVAPKPQQRKDIVLPKKKKEVKSPIPPPSPRPARRNSAQLRVPKLPSAPPTKALSMSGRSADQIQARLKKKSPWFQSISDPLSGADAKIPDETGIETGTVQIVQKVTVVVNAQNMAGVQVVSPYINLAQGEGGDPGLNYQVTDVTASTTDVIWSDGAGAAGGFEFSGSGDLRAITNAHRIVSAAMYVQPEASLATNQGEMTLFTQPFSTTVGAPYGTYLNLYKSVTLPLNAGGAGKVLWYPVAREDENFKSFFSTTGTTFSSTISEEANVPYWGFGFVADGAEIGTTIRATIVVNYEFIPTFNTLNVLDASPSPNDVTETDLVENWTQDLPVASQVSTAAAAKSPSSVEPQHGANDAGTGFGMFFNVLSELAPLALALL